MREVLHNVKAAVYSAGTIMAAIALVFYIGTTVSAATDPTATDPGTTTTDPGTGTTTTPVTTDPTTTDPTTTTPTDTTTPTTTDTSTPTTTTTTPTNTTSTTTSTPSATTTSSASKTITKTATKTTPVATSTVPVATTDTTQTTTPTAETIPSTKSSVVSKASAITTVPKKSSFNPLPIIVGVIGFVVLAGAAFTVYRLKFRRKRAVQGAEPVARESVFEQALETAPPELVPVPISTESTRVAQPHAPALHVPAQINPYRMLVQ